MLQERPDAILPTMGGQTALNLAKALSEVGTAAGGCWQGVGDRPGQVAAKMPEMRLPGRVAGCARRAADAVAPLRRCPQPWTTQPCPPPASPQPCLEPSPATPPMQQGILDKYGVELIGAKLESINKAEDRDLFAQVGGRWGRGPRKV